MRKLPLTRRTHGMAFDARPNPSFACQTSLASTTLLSKATEESQLHSNKQVRRGAVVATGCTPTGVTWRIASQELRAKLHALKAQVVHWSSFPETASVAGIFATGRGLQPLRFFRDRSAVDSIHYALSPSGCGTLCSCACALAYSRPPYVISFY